MKRLTIVLTGFFILVNLPAQDSLSLKDPVAPLQTIEDSLQKKQQEDIRKETNDQMDRNLSAFVRMQKEREKKEKQKMYVRIALGILFLIVLIVGLMRRRQAAK